MTRHGESAAAIAVRLDVTPRTVIRYRARLRQQQAA
jgi:DNA-binding CsgD family transcriptional regulator